MRIYEAATKALEENQCMTRKCWKSALVYAEKVAWHSEGPVADNQCEFICYGKAWKPKADDILADDWEVVPPKHDTEPEKCSEYYDWRLPEQVKQASSLGKLAFILAVIALLFSAAVLLWK